MAKLSPWAYAGFGCLGVAVLAVVGIGGVGMMVSKTIQEDVKKPVDRVALMKALSVPVYPGATLDETQTRGLRAGTSFATKLASMQITGAAFQVADPPAKIAEWYKTELPKQGFTFESEKHEVKGGKSMDIIVFRQKDDQISVQTTDKYGLLLMRVRLPQKK